MVTTYKRQSVEKYIIKSLQMLGGSGSRKAIKEEIVSDKTIDISYEDVFQGIKSRNGNRYIPFTFDFNYGIINLRNCGYVQDYSRGDEIVLTEKGRKSDFQLFPSLEEKAIMNEYWNIKKEERLKRKQDNQQAYNENVAFDLDKTDAYTRKDLYEDWKLDILDKIKSFSPRKFESFSRLLLTQMGVKFDAEKGVKISGDHGIDGYGYFESDEFRTAKVVIQCKRYSDVPVSEPDIDRFKGVMLSFNADYGIFITTSYFTSTAQEKAVKGANTVTLIDGQRLVDLIEKYQLHITPIQTYEINDYYNQVD